MSWGAGVNDEMCVHAMGDETVVRAHATHHRRSYKKDYCGECTLMMTVGTKNDSRDRYTLVQVVIVVCFFTNDSFTIIFR